MGVIKLTLPIGEVPVNGKQVTFTAPCSCQDTEALEIDGTRYTVVDALCRCVTGVGGRWAVGATVSVILDVDNKRAYLQNEGGVLSSKTNLLRNWYLADPINQRGQTEYSGTAWMHTIDRWKTRNATDVVTVGDGVTLTETSAKSAAYLSQLLDNAEHLLGKTITLSVMLGDGSVQYASATLPTANPSGSTAYATTEYSRVVFMQGYWWVCLAAAKGTANTFLAVKLEFGDTQTLAYQDADGNWVLNDPPPDKNDELLKCVQCKVDTSDTYANKIILHTGNVTAGTADITAGTTALANGCQYLVYE